MQLQTILNHVEKYKSFVYAESKWRKNDGEVSLEIKIEARRNGKPICSGCGEVAPGYDRQPARDFEYVALWGIAVYFVYALRRVDCRQCGVRVERVPWATGKQQLTTTYQWFLARWAKRLSWQRRRRRFTPVGKRWRRRSPWRELRRKLRFR